MIVPLLALAYLGVGVYRTQVRAEKPEPLWHALVWPVGPLVAGK